MGAGVGVRRRVGRDAGTFRRRSLNSVDKMTYAVYLGTLWAIYALSARGASLVGHLSGVTAMCMPVAFATGAYTFAVLKVALGVNASVAMVLAVLGGAISFIPLIAMSLRIAGDLLVIGTLAYQQIFYQLIRNIADLSKPLGSPDNLTNGTLGVAGTRLRIDFANIGSDLMLLIVVLVLLGLCELLHRSFVMRPFRIALLAVQDESHAANLLGIRVPIARLLTLGAAGSTLALAGALYAGLQGYIGPEVAGIQMAFVFLAFGLIGRADGVFWVVLGPAVIIIAPELLRLGNFTQSGLENFRVAIAGLFVVAFAATRSWQASDITRMLRGAAH